MPTAVVFVVDDDVSVRESLEHLIRVSGWAVEAFDSARTFLDRPAVDVPSCLILDVELPGLSGLDLQKLLVENGKTMPIIFITGHGDIPMSVRAMKAGAAEFLTKPFADGDLLNALRHAVERSEFEWSATQELHSLQSRYQSLTPRERQVMGLVVSGLLNKQIGGELGTSEITVKAHRGQVMRKMNTESLADLVRIAGRLGLPLAMKERPEKPRAIPSS
ncbi:MAG: two component transcriptional regulator, LuxR family [Candidatus Eremiobacteraeota bacterium]|nr:two component transcriptional regulator, LuxR family [Candidatus Eremiobacteraeota bacterium]